jgi:hypothetical protein
MEQLESYAKKMKAYLKDLDECGGLFLWAKDKWHRCNNEIEKI